MKKFKIFAFVLGMALALVAGFSAELLASKTCCSRICDEPSIGLLAAADNSPPLVNEVTTTFHAVSGTNVVAVGTMSVADFDVAVWSQYGEVPAVLRCELATAATGRSDFRQFAVSVGSRDHYFPAYYESRARNSQIYAKSPRDLITGFARRNDGYNPANLRWC